MSLAGARLIKTRRGVRLRGSKVLFVTPKYNRSIPGGLRNAFDRASRPWRQNSFAQAVGRRAAGDRHWSLKNSDSTFHLPSFCMTGFRPEKAT